MGLFNSVSGRTRLYWVGLVILASSCIVFFSTIWYSVYPVYDYSFGNEPDNVRITKNLTGSMPVLVGSIVFIVLGTHMTLSGRKRI